MDRSLEMRWLQRAISGNVVLIPSEEEPQSSVGCSIGYKWEEKVRQSSPCHPLLGGRQLENDNGGGSSSCRGGFVSLESASEAAGGA